jgi:hypothetical protein
MIDKTHLLVTSFDPVLFNKWIIKVSINRVTAQVCIIMAHERKALLRIGFFDTEDGANDFICSVIEEMGNV